MAAKTATTSTYVCVLDTELEALLASVAAVFAAVTALPTAVLIEPNVFVMLVKELVMLVKEFCMVVMLEVRPLTPLEIVVRPELSELKLALKSFWRVANPAVTADEMLLEEATWLFTVNPVLP